MAKINVKPNEFADIAVSFFLDKFLHPEEVVPNNNDFDELIEKMRGKGLKTSLMRYFLDMDSKMRVKYKIIKDVFEEGASEASVINISPDKIEKKGKGKVKPKGLLKRVINKIIKDETISDDEKALLLESLEEESNG